MERPGEVAMRALLQRASLKSMAGSVLGLEGGAASEELGEMVREGYELVGTFNLGDYYYTTLWGPLMDLWGVGPRVGGWPLGLEGILGRSLRRGGWQGTTRRGMTCSATCLHCQRRRGWRTLM